MHIDLQHLMKIFKKNHMQVQEIVPEMPVLGGAYLKVTYTPFDESSEKVIEVALLSPQEINLAFESHESFYLLQFYYAYPFHPSHQSVAETCRLIAHYNATSPIPGFAYVEGSNVSYRCSIPLAAHSEMTEKFIMGIFNTITAILEGCEEYLFAVAKKHVHLSTLIKESEDQLYMDIIGI